MFFRDWLETQVHRDDDIGELAKLARGGMAPRVGNSKFTWSIYLQATFPGDKRKMETFQAAWKQYIQAKKSVKEKQ